MEREYYLRRLKLAEQTSAPLGVGAFIEGNVLLVGEQSSGPSKMPEREPFCSSLGCSGWLNSLLEKERIPEERLFWVSPNLTGEAMDLRSVVQDLKPTAVIALGNEAKKACLSQGVKHISVHHPQYWKMFRPKSKYPLIDLLKFLTYV